MEEDDRLVRQRREARVEVLDNVSNTALRLILLGGLQCDLDEHVSDRSI